MDTIVRTIGAFFFAYGAYLYWGRGYEVIKPPWRWGPSYQHDLPLLVMAMVGGLLMISGLYLALAGVADFP